MRSITIFNRFLTVALASAALLTTSCKKDPSETPNTGNKLVRIEESGSSYTTLSYDGADKLVKLTAVEDGETEVINLTYSNNKVSTATSASNAVKFNYNNAGQLQKIDLHEGTLQTPVASYLQFAYQNNVLNDITTFALFPGSTEAQQFIKQSFEYYPNGDIKVLKDYQYNILTHEMQLSKTTTFEYDNNPNPLVSLGEIYYISFEAPSKHNPTKATAANSENQIVETTTFTYTYNANGYPVEAKKSVKEPGQTNPTVSSTKYTYQ